ncbi:hypothetical protein C3941_16945 [Kaistia algarum]|uniref:hypothetical protein n=1 Tax=Kaistia algarum TaxID=2083279 RepID=UPI000CE87B81|nr:hypothetical protein [Kaistia algarum]MCX5516350.1 hypothetical protein [Kaistia algarum]PPE78733.1 hypothetical protein C3941_16945 [Kaistia algarum]
MSDKPSASKAPRPIGAPRAAKGAKAAKSSKALKTAKQPLLLWRTPLIFALVVPGLFMLIDMSFEQATQPTGFSPARLWSWIADDGFLILRAVYALGALPAAFAGLLVARRDQRGGSAPRFAFVVFVLFAVPVAVLFARNLFLFPPPPISEQILIGLRVMTSVVIAGLVCYALTRWIVKGSR